MLRADPADRGPTGRRALPPRARGGARRWLATKDDLRAEIDALEGAMKALERATKADLRAEVATLELRLVKWIVGTGVAVAGLVVAGVAAALRLLG